MRNGHELDFPEEGRMGLEKHKGSKRWSMDNSKKR